ncbi:hypothetical protein KCP76_13930 [Salmonella enterica subsp. enterica serovar Weltevreden]|nr:hypothetical protein KCP76_13930 [Salmonella enterica subsp. enterica serovar Weltevreden]
MCRADGGERLIRPTDARFARVDTGHHLRAARGTVGAVYSVSRGSVAGSGGHVRLMAACW